MSRRRKPPRKIRRRPAPDVERAERTTPVAAHYVEIDDTRTFLVFGAFTESMISVGFGRAPEATVRADLTGKWNHGAEDKPVLLMSPDTARGWGQALLDVADGADRDLVTYLSGVHPATGKPLGTAGDHP